MWMTGHAGGVEVLPMMAASALHAYCATSVGAADNKGPVKTHLIGLRWPFARRVAVHAARMLEHLAGLNE
jgi:hypothetical protein